MDFSEFALAWEQDHREPIIIGGTISSCNTGVETRLFDQLGNMNVDLFFVVNNQLKIKEDRLQDFTRLAHQMLNEGIKTSMRFGPKNIGRDLLYIETCETVANLGATRLEDIYLAEKATTPDRKFPWYGLANKAMREFGGIPAACAADALGFIALAIILIRERRFQFAWCAALSAQSLISYAIGHSLSESAARLKYSSNGKAGALKRHQPRARLMEYAIGLYKQKKWNSANEAAFELQQEIINHGKTINANLKPSNAQRTIAEWFRKSV
jgi:hypothetical protein